MSDAPPGHGLLGFSSKCEFDNTGFVPLRRAFSALLPFLLYGNHQTFTSALQSYELTIPNSPAGPTCPASSYIKIGVLEVSCRSMLSFLCSTKPAPPMTPPSLSPVPATPAEGLQWAMWTPGRGGASCSLCLLRCLMSSEASQKCIMCSARSKTDD